MLAGKLVRRKKIHNFLTLSRPADVVNSVLLNFPVVGVVNDNHRTVRACHSSGSAPYGTSRTSPMLPGRASFRRACACRPSSLVGGRASHLMPQTKQASRSVGR